MFKKYKMRFDVWEFITRDILKFFVVPYLTHS